MSSIISNIVGIAEKITSIPQQIADKLGLSALFSALSEKVVAIKYTLANIPGIIRDHIKDIFSNMIDTVVSLPSKIKGYIVDLRDTVLEKLRSIMQGIIDLPDKMGDAIIGLFLPSDGFIEGKVQHFRDKLLAMGIDTYNMGPIFNTEQPFTDITCTIRGQTVIIVRMDVVDMVVKKFRPVIRGFMWLMLVFYNINQFLRFIGQEGMTLGGIVKTADTESKRSWLDG